ncbi:MAG: DUF7670 domain-containing protein [Patescibacteria group bacterium]
MKKFFYWAPRVLGILFIGFISIFALDVFSEGYGAGEFVLALVMHLLPSFFGVGILYVAWKWERIGGWLFVVFGVAFLFIGGFETMSILLFSVPLCVIGGLFLMHHYRYSGHSSSGVLPEGAQVNDRAEHP